MNQNSCLYVGQVSHRRFEPVAHKFTYRLFMVYLDLDEIDRVFAGRWLWSTRRAAVAWFRRKDHFGDPKTALSLSVRDFVEKETGRRPQGPIRLLTHLRYFGYCFNPVSFYYCFCEGGNEVIAIVAEVNNTPWGEQTLYVVSADEVTNTLMDRSLDIDKQLHVSPFMPMDIRYQWRLGLPADTLSIHMKNTRRGSRLFDATLRLEKRTMTSKNLSMALVRFPLMTLRVVSAIYYQAVRLWLKRVPVYDHPSPSKPSGMVKKA